MSGLFDSSSGPGMSGIQVTVPPGVVAAPPPGTITDWIPAVTQAVGSLTKGISEYQSGSTNAAAATAEGKQALAAGAEATARQRRLVANILSKQVATTGGQGTTMEGSPMEVYLANAKQGELEAQDANYAAMLKSRAKKMEAYNAQQKGRAGLTAGVIGGISPLLNKLA